MVSSFEEELLRAGRRDRKRDNKRKMKVSGAGLIPVQEAIIKKARTLQKRKEEEFQSE